MQRENNEPGYCILFKAQGKLNWSLSGAIAPVAIMLLNYMQKKRSLVYPPTNHQMRGILPLLSIP